MSQTAPPARVTFVGAGPGDPGLLTLRAVEALGRADAVIVDRLPRGEIIRAHCRPDVSVLEDHPGQHTDGALVAQTARLVVETALAHPGGSVVRLMDGDPSIFNGAAEEALACSNAGVPFDVVPGVSAVTAVAAYAGVPLSTTETSGIHVLTSPEEAVTVTPASTVVSLGPAERVRAVLAALVDGGWDRRTAVALTEHGTTVHQATSSTTLAGAVTQLGKAEALQHVYAVVGPTVALREQLSWFETKPLFGWSVLVPRTQEQSGTMVERLQTYGAEATIVPTIGVEPPRTPHQIERAVRGLVTGRYEWVGFTSVNAVRAIRAKFDEYGVDARALAGVRVAAVGGVTAAALREWGVNPDLVPSGEQSARGLLVDWPEFDEGLDPINRVFLPRADIATDTLVAGLRDMGWEVDDVTAYRTVRAAPPPAPIRDAIKAGAFDAVLFTSSSTVRNLIGIAGKPHQSTIIACIGPATAKTAEELGLRVDVVAAEASAPALVDALAEHGRALSVAAAEAGQAWRRPSQRRARRRAR